MMQDKGKVTSENGLSKMDREGNRFSLELPEGAILLTPSF